MKSLLQCGEASFTLICLLPNRRDRARRSGRFRAISEGVVLIE